LRMNLSASQFKARKLRLLLKNIHSDSTRGSDSTLLLCCYLPYKDGVVACAICVAQRIGASSVQSHFPYTYRIFSSFQLSNYAF
jgi:hypothetical protein